MNTTWTAYGLAGALAVLAVVPSRAAGTAGAQFLKVAASARAVAMGSATGATSQDVTATQGNPAGLADIEDLQFTASHNDGLVDTQHQFLAAALPFGKNALGVSITRMDFGEIERYSASDARDGSFDAGSMAAGVTLARRVNEAVSVGATVKMVQEKIDGESASTFAGDLGVLWNTGTWALGAALQHVGPAMKFVEEDTDLPTTARLSAARRMFHDKMTLALEASLPRDNDMTLHGGAEYALSPLFAVRGGYTATPGNQTDLGGLVGLTGGVGVNLGRFSLDYGIQPFGDLGISQRVSLTARFASL
jgi:hypothetical protein